jgi:preprotein translocase subunit YajC
LGLDSQYIIKTVIIIMMIIIIIIRRRRRRRRKQYSKLGRLFKASKHCT